LSIGHVISDKRCHRKRKAIILGEGNSFGSLLSLLTVEKGMRKPW
jgi:hypothetical protein